MIEMSTATAMGIGVSHGTAAGETGVTSGCRLRAQSQGQSTQAANPQQQTSQQSQPAEPRLQEQLSLQECQSNKDQQAQRTTPHSGRSKKDNCCLCWCCCCSCSNKCLAAVGSGNGGGSGPGSESKKKRGLGIGGEPGSGLGHQSDHTGSGAGNGLDSLDGLDGTLECCGLEEVRSWGSSFDKLMRSPAGRKVFREFLISEYSEENIAFWLACEQLKRENNPEKIEEKARYIYEDYISILSPKEVSLDSRVREIVNRNMVEPTPHTFDEAQLQIYTLMHRDSYPRFVNSEIFRRVARLGSGPPSPADDNAPVGKSKSKKSIT
ncbi:regulator of G-protein signaling 17 isoform X2 [Chelonus insularis]|uniref:regulator of G-protein signaling 17 isoform X2 n=1 Tax=Chelonus insularis TaxID=460826 RepID=UPI00158B8C96|nr:regulator of G-protein signaling 17 isoform X2 [Chelonus insularis]